MANTPPNKDEKKRKLGRGLSALLGNNEGFAATATATAAAAPAAPAPGNVPIEFLRPGRFQPRRLMDDGTIDELAKSIAEKGILQPLLLRPLPGGGANEYEIIAGERRWRAAQRAKLHEVPAIIRDLDDRQTLEIALVENLQRQDLSPLEEADGYQRLMDEFRHTQEDLSKAVGKSRSHVANMLRLQGLSRSVRKLVDEGRLSAGHARALLGIENPLDLAKKIIKQGLSVRQAEQLAKSGMPGIKLKKTPPPKDADTLALERDLAEILGLKVEINYKPGKGSLTIHYKSLGQLDDVLERLSNKP